MLRRTLEKQLWGPLFHMNDGLLTPPKLRFHPKNIALDFDAAFASFLLELRASSELSRETILSQFDMDQSDEASMIERERDTYDDIFRTAMPFDSPQNNQTRNPATQKPTTPEQQRRAGRGGGAAPGTGQGQPAKRPRRTSD